VVTLQEGQGGGSGRGLEYGLFHHDRRPLARGSGVRPWSSQNALATSQSLTLNLVFGRRGKTRTGIR